MVDIYGYRPGKRDESYQNQKDPTTYRVAIGNLGLVRQSSLFYIGESRCHLLICAEIMLDHGQ